jgi:predicted phosphate transport protein (TIGR00153 family)
LDSGSLHLISSARQTTTASRGEELDMPRFQIIPRNLDFYALFERAAANLAETAELLNKLITDFNDPEAAHAEIRQREHEGDEITHEIMRALNTTFVTPFDREDIHRLASGLDDILDGMEAVSDLLVLHHIEQILPEMKQQAEVLARSADQTHQAMTQLRGFAGLDRFWVEINRLENEGDQVYRKTVAHLFSGEFKAMDVLKWKDLVDQLEAAIDGCEDVANTLESIVLKHA